MRLWLTVASALAALGVSDAYTASNGVPPGPAGAGSGSISGYAVSNVHYELDGAAVSSVSFTLDPPAAGTARVRLSSAGAWFPCTIAAGVASCELGGGPVAALERLTVVASA